MQIWHGEQDHIVTAEHVDVTAQRLRQCVVVTWPDVGHLGIAKHGDEILAALD